MLRMLLPYIIGSLTTLFVLILICKVIVAYAVEELRPVIRRIFYVLYGMLVLSFVGICINMASVNEVPRSVIDNTSLEQGKNNFQSKLDQDASKPKVTDSLINTKK